MVMLKYDRRVRLLTVRREFYKYNLSVLILNFVICSYRCHLGWEQSKISRLCIDVAVHLGASNSNEPFIESALPACTRVQCCFHCCTMHLLSFECKKRKKANKSINRKLKDTVCRRRKKQSPRSLGYFSSLKAYVAHVLRFACSVGWTDVP